MSATATELVVLDAQLVDLIHVGRHRPATVPTSRVVLARDLCADWFAREAEALAEMRANRRELRRLNWRRRSRWLARVALAVVGAGCAGDLVLWFGGDRWPAKAGAVLIGSIVLALVYVATGQLGGGGGRRG